MMGTADQGPLSSQQNNELLRNFQPISTSTPPLSQHHHNHRLRSDEYEEVPGENVPLNPSNLDDENDGTTTTYNGTNNKVSLGSARIK